MKTRSALPLLLLFPILALAQDSPFVYRQGTSLFAGRERFTAVGVNAYYLAELAARGDTTRVRRVFDTARELGLTVVRTWAFHDGGPSSDPAVIQRAPGVFNETGLRGLDYVVAAASEAGVRLILPLVNNWDDYGGMNQYVRWLAEMAPRDGARRDEMPESITATMHGHAGRSYELRIGAAFSHDDFYTHPTAKQWYKEYVRMLLNRRNVFTERAYKDEPAIMVWELANEPRSSDVSGTIVYEWVAEMSAFLRSIAPNHLIATGEEGHDVTPRNYRARAFGPQRWMFDGSTGVSFIRNTTVPTVDVATLHCFPEEWGIPPASVVEWVDDHHRIAAAMQKPMILGEFGVRRDWIPLLDGVMSLVWDHRLAGVLVWHFADSRQAPNDAYAFTCATHGDRCALLRLWAERLQRQEVGTDYQRIFRVLENYPNPFKRVTAVRVELAEPAHLRAELFDLLGRRVAVLDDRMRAAGDHVLLFDAHNLASGVYLLRVDVGTELRVLRVVVAK